MHTRKRHQDMFQDLNRKIHSADKDRESPPVDAKAAKRWSVSSASSDKTNMSVKSSTLFALPPSTPSLFLILFSFFPPFFGTNRFIEQRYMFSCEHSYLDLLHTDKTRCVLTEEDIFFLTYTNLLVSLIPTIFSSGS